MADEDIELEANLHLQGLGKYVSAMDLVRYFRQEDVRQRYGFTISLATVRQWMKRMGMRWMKTPKGQYVDGHERPDVVDYRQNTYIPKHFGSQLLSGTIALFTHFSLFFLFVSLFNPHSFIMTSYVLICSYFSSLTARLYVRYSAH